MIASLRFSKISKLRGRQFGAAVAIATTFLFAALGERIKAAPAVQTTVIATRLNDPRGLEFGPDKNLYVAEAGTGGSTSTAGICDQVQFPVGPYLGGSTARIVAIAPDGSVRTVADHLPSNAASPIIGGDRSGVADVTFVGNHLLALLSGGGCSHGHIDADNGIYAVQGGGLSMIANLSAWLLDNPGAKGAEEPRNRDYEPDGTWYSIIFDQGRLYAVEPNHGLLVSIQHTDGRIDLVKDLFATFGDHTYTTLAVDRGDLYIGALGQIVFGFASNIYRLSRDGSATQFATGLHAVLGLAFDQRHRLYALQSPIFVPGTGSLVRLDGQGNIEPILTHLVFPGGLTTGPDGALYLSECSYHCASGDGRILRVVVP